MKRQALLVSLAVCVALAACGGSGGRSGSSSPTTAPSSLPACPLDALAGAKKPVQITYWHAMTRANEDELKKLTDRFNAQHPDIHVNLSGAPSYIDNITRFKAGLSTHALPDLMQGDDASTQTIIDSRAVLPMASCLQADHATTSDLVPQVVAYYTVQNVLWGLPFNNSNRVLYYDKRLFE